MSKSASIVLICIVSVLILFFGVFAFYPNVIEYGEYYEYRSPMYFIQKSNALTDSQKSVYQVKLDEGSNFDSVKSIIGYRLAKAYGYYDVSIDFDSDKNEATIVIPKTNNPDGVAATTILSNVIVRGKVEIMNSSSVSSYAESSVLLTTEHFKGASTQTYASGSNTISVCEVSLTPEGQELASKTLSSSTYTLIALDETVSQSYAVYFNNNRLQIQTLGSVDALAAYINTGVLNATLTLDDTRTQDVEVIGGLVYIIVLAVIVLATLIFFAVRYNVLGIAGILSQLFAVVAFMIAAGGIHMEMFNVAAAVGVILAYSFMTFFTIWTFEKIRKLQQTKTYGSSKYTGFKSCNKLSLIAHAVFLVLGIILWVIPTSVTAPIGNVFVYGAVLSFVATFGLNRLFAKVVEPLVEDKNAKFVGKKK